MTEPIGASRPPSSRAVLELFVIIVLTIALPAALRFGRVASGEVAPRLPYLPALEGTRGTAFHDHRIEELRRLRPGSVIIGDSMAGTRINERLLGQLAGAPVAPLLQAGSGPAFWYLALKNWVIASGIRPRVVFIFFRDTNLTDTMFRLDEQFRWSLDTVAGEREDELNEVVRRAAGGPRATVHAAVERLYGGDAARRRLEPLVTQAPAAWITASRRRQREILAHANERFGLDHLRVMEAADIDDGDAETDFDAHLGQSVLPLMFRDASRAGLKLCLVRVQRRPAGGAPPRQSAALRRYVAALRRYVEAQGGVLHDDTGDPAMTLDMYSDGDHIARSAQDRYTTLFFERLRPLFHAGRPQP